jgi:hypothetical protein
MKAKNTLKNPSSSERRRIPLALVSTLVIMLLTLSGQAANVLVNPSFDSSPLFASGSWSQHASETWSMASASASDPTSIKLVRSGGSGLWMQGLYGNGQGGPQTSYAAQSFACTPGNTYTADAWYSAYLICNQHIGGDDGSTLPGGSGLYGSDSSGNEDGWVEVMFFDSNNILIADYKSAIVDPVFVRNTSLPTVTNALGNVYLAWIDCQVTNQYDPATVTPNTDPSTNSPVGPSTQVITGTLAPGQFITAPAGAVRGEFRINLYQAAFEAGAPFWDDATLTQVGGASASIIGSVSPDGSKFFNGNDTNFSFTVTSASAGGAPLPNNPTNGISVVVNGQNKTSTLQFSGTPTLLNVSLPGLASNTLYTISVSVTNSAALVSSKIVNFDTFPTNIFVVSAEDYDFTNGMFIQNPVPTSTPAANSYFGTAGVLGVDLNTYAGSGALPGGASQLVRADNNSAMQKADDIQLPQYLAANDANVYNVQIAYNNGGNWFNYTRNYPAGTYLVYLRYNNPTAGNVESLNLLTSGYGTSTQTTTNLGVFIGANTGAGYAWAPLTDTFGNKVLVNLPAGQNTLQLLSGNGVLGGVANFVDYVFVPAGTVFPPVINNLSPNNINPPVNGNIFLNVPNITFSVNSTFSTVTTNNIHAYVNGVDMASKATFTGNNTSWNVSLPAPQNQLISLMITATDAGGLSNSLSESFDTFSQTNLMIEAVDFDFNGGQFIDNPVPTAGLTLATNSYYDGGVDTTNMAIQNVDYNGFPDTAPGGGEAWNYRPLDTGVGQEVTGDFKRLKFTNDFGVAQDYDIGYWNGGFWENYTRTFPTNNFNVYSRMAGGAGPFSGTTLSLVTSGRGTTTQTTQTIGSFSDANAAGWAVWHWVPMRDTNGNLATISLGGVQTVRVTSGNNANAHFFMFVPTAVSLSVNLSVSVSGATVSLKFPTANGHSYTVQWNTTIVGGTWQPLSTAVTGDGTVKTATDTLTPIGTRYYRLLIQ